MLRYLQKVKDDPDAHFQLGLIYLDEKDASKALKSFLKSVKLETEPDVKHLYFAGKAYLQMKNYHKALDFLQRAEKAEDENPAEILHTLSLAHYQIGKSCLQKNF